MKKITLKILLCVTVTCSWLAGSAAHLTNQLMVSAKLDGSQQVPMLTTNAKGVASFVFNDSWDSLSFNISVTGLSGPITGIHVHEGDVGSNGGVITNLTPFVKGNRVVGVLAGSDLTPAMKAKYLSGTYYVNVHTEANPNGEIRGQLMLETDWSFKASLDTMQQNHSVTTNAQGIATFALNHSKTKLQVRLVADGLSADITAAHLHAGAVGVDGGVELNLSTMIVNGNTLVGEADVTADLVAKLISGDIYINVHTADNPNGEIRGQVMLEKNIAFDSWLNTTQQVIAPTITDAYGVSNLALNATLDSLLFNVQFADLSGVATAAHIHNANPGVDGSVLVNLTEFINGNRITGKVAVSLDMVTALLEGATYLNVHTTDNPSGEIRGQIYRLAREAYTISMEGAQSVPATMVNAMGGGLVSIDRNQSNVHYMMVVSDLTKPLTAAHFHVAVKGKNGGVIYNLSDKFTQSAVNDYAFGYWTAADGFATTNSVQFRNDSVYVNVHTDANPNGEIRGQVERGFTIYEHTMVDNGMIPMDPMFSGQLLFSAKLTGAQEVIPVTTDAVGVAGLLLNKTMDTLWVNINVDGLSGDITGIHIHEGTMGVNGSVIHNLESDLSGNQVRGFITDFDLSKFIDEMYYINVHTAANGGGEIRGQITLETDWAFNALINGLQQAPAPVVTTALGWGAFSLSKDAKFLEVKAVFSGLSGPVTGIHLHNAAAGSNGGVVVDLMTLLDGNTLSGKIDATGIVAELMAGNIYINVHTDDNPNGEIRGQLVMGETLSFDGWLNGAQQFPTPAMSDAMGVVSISANATWDTLTIGALVDGLSGEITGAHLHSGAVGESGGVLINLTSNVVNNYITAQVTGSELTPAFYQALLAGEIYLNIHTDNFANGEVRAQIFSLAREGYSFQLCNEQQVPTVDASGYGGGIVSIDRTKSNAHYMFTTTGATGAINAAHFHNASAGLNGDVIYDITPKLVGNSAFGYFTAADGFDATVAEKFKMGEVYVNTHTTANANGELRGQVVKTLDCPEIVTAISSSLNGVELSLFPNPVVDRLNINLDRANLTGTVVVTVSNVVGKVISVQNISNSTSIDTSNLAEGMYLVQLSNGASTVTYKVMKN